MQSSKRKSRNTSTAQMDIRLIDDYDGEDAGPAAGVAPAEAAGAVAGAAAGAALAFV